MQPATSLSACRVALVTDVLTEEDGEEDEGCYVEDLQILELLVQPADDRRRQEDGEESDGQPARIVTVRFLTKDNPKVTNMVVTRLKSDSNATPTNVGK